VLNGSVTYVADLETLRTFTEAWATEVENARMGDLTLLVRITALTDIQNEVITARGGEINLSTRLANMYDSSSGLTVNLIGNGYRATGMANAVDPQDLTTLSQVNSLISGSVGTITDLDYGTALDGDIYVRSGLAVSSIPKSSLNVTDLGKGTATEGQCLKISGGVIVGDDCGGGGGGGYTPAYIATNTTAETGKLYFIDTSLGEVTLTLPLTMADGFYFTVVDRYRTFNTYNAHIGRNGHTIEDLSEDYDFTLDGEAIEWMYILADDNLKRIG